MKNLNTDVSADTSSVSVSRGDVPSSSNPNRIESDYIKVIRDLTNEYLDGLDKTRKTSLETIRMELYTKTKVTLATANALKPRDDVKFKVPNGLIVWQIAAVLVRVCGIVRLNTRGVDGSSCQNQPLGYYVKEGDQEGIYSTNPDKIIELIMELVDNLSQRVCNDVEMSVRSMAPIRCVCRDPELVAVKNGIFNVKTKQLIPFTPDIVFLSKTGVDYVDKPVNLVIVNPDTKESWDVESWMKSLTDDREVQDLLWEIVSSVLRPRVAWNKVLLFYSEQGNNGKGTFCQMLRNLIPNANASITIDQFAKEFELEDLLYSQAVITDENDVGSFGTNLSKFKAAITHDSLTINAKFKKPQTISWQGVIIECMNDLPKMKDRTESLYRRFLIVPFDKCFTGRERPEIKHDYLARQDVLEYVQYKALNMTHYEFSNPRACQEVLETYKNYNDSVREFWSEFREQFVWDLLPWNFLYDLYKEWFRENYPSGSIGGRNTFMKDLTYLVRNDSVWKAVATGSGQVRTGDKMLKSEHLIWEYQLKKWMSSGYKGSDIDRVCIPDTKDVYRGIIRF